MKLLYPACFYPYEESDSGYTVEVPDLPGCVSCGDNLAEAFAMGTDAASGWILSELEEGNSIPTPSNIADISTDSEREGGFVALLYLDMDSYAEKYGAKSERKNVTLPAYMATFAEINGLSLSQVLQEALGKKIASR